MVTLVLLILHCHGHLATVVQLCCCPWRKVQSLNNVFCFEGRKTSLANVPLQIWNFTT